MELRFIIIQEWNIMWLKKRVEYYTQVIFCFPCYQYAYSKDIYNLVEILYGFSRP
jgi:hypothetical protein